MAISSVMNTGLQGVTRGIQGMQRNADNIARMGIRDEQGDIQGVNSADAAESMVGLKQNELQVKAAAEVVKTASDTIGTILDIKA